MLLLEQACSGSIFGPQVSRKTLDAIESCLDQRPAHLFQMNSGWMSPKDQS
jgi:hypothetical protein